jgi:hypothetical protein
MVSNYNNIQNSPPISSQLSLQETATKKEIHKEDSLIQHIRQHALEKPPSQNFLSKLIYGKTYAQLKIPKEGNSEETQSVFVKVSVLSQKLGFSEKGIRQLDGKQGDVTSLLEARKTLERENYNNELIGKISNFVNKTGNLELFMAIAQLSPTIKAENLTKLLQDPRFKETKMQKTVVKAAEVVQKQLQASDSSKSPIYEKKSSQHYGFVVDDQGQVFIRTDVLGTGAYKKVLNALSLQDLEEYVHGAIKPRTSDFGKDLGELELQKEQTMLKNLKDVPGIVPAHKFSLKTGSSKGGYKYVFLQKKMAGDGSKLLNATPRKQLGAMRDVAKGLSGMHDKGYVHSDFKLVNMLVDKEGNGYVTDFGLSTENGKYKGTTPIYASPELVNARATGMAANMHKACNSKLDSYAFGLSMFQLIAPQNFIGSIINAIPGLKDIVVEGLLSAPIMLKLTIPPSVQDFNKLSQNEMNKLIEDSKQAIQKDKSLSKEEKSLKLQMLEISKRLMAANPEERMSCKEAAEKLDRLAKQYDELQKAKGE